MEKIKIGGRLVGGDEPCFVIAEAGSNWHYCDDMEKNHEHALRLIDLAAEAGVDAVKFQLYRAERLYTRGAGHADYLNNRKSIYELIKNTEVPYSWLNELKSYCEGLGLVFLATPFDEDSVDALEDIGVAAYKIASYTITHRPLLEYISGTGKPIILSTGASTLPDIREAVKWIVVKGNKQIALMQCTAKYPAQLNTINLRAIPRLKERFKMPVGLSDHSREPTIAPFGAVALGANLIEKHYTTDNCLEGADHSFAILPNELKEMVAGIRGIEAALGGSEKTVQAVEQELYDFARRRIHATRTIKKGETLTHKNIAVLRSGKVAPGLEPKYLKEIIGRKAGVEIKKDEGIQWELMEEQID
ncbi:MAG: shikimate dehydrogenase [Epsilonproteobacteria bacterium]|nr:MAG: shikimate dehydrogenase [Campylobacterota bacterium]